MLRQTSKYWRWRYDKPSDINLQNGQKLHDMGATMADQLVAFLITSC